MSTSEIIGKAAERLKGKLKALDLETLNISSYTRNYLNRKLTGIDRTFELYGQLLELTVKHSVTECELIDYGAGSGVCSLLAYEAGFKTVVYNDIYDVACADFKVLCRALEINWSHIVCGDVDELGRYLEQHSIAPTAMVSFDVIEHIYNVEDFFKKAACLPGLAVRIVFGSTANTANPLARWRLKAYQLKHEYEDRQPLDGHKERDSLKSFLKIRESIIQNYAPNLEAAVVDSLATSSRGLMQPDIEAAVENFIKTGNLPIPPVYPANTCDPLTGNWAEHLIDLKWLKRVTRQSGFNVEIIPGRYSIHQPLAKRIPTALLNIMIDHLPQVCLPVAPHYIIVADRCA